MPRGKVVLVPFPFVDPSGTKVRPAACLTDPIGIHRHVILAFITSQVPPDPVATDVTLQPSDPGFPSTGLRTASTIRPHRLLTVTTRFILRELGTLPMTVQSRIDAHLRGLFGL